MGGIQTGRGTVEVIREHQPEPNHKGMTMAREEGLQCFRLQETCLPRSPVTRQVDLPVLPEVQ